MTQATSTKNSMPSGEYYFGEDDEIQNTCRLYLESARRRIDRGTTFLEVSHNEDDDSLLHSISNEDDLHVVELDEALHNNSDFSSSDDDSYAYEDDSWTSNDGFSASWEQLENVANHAISSMSSKEMKVKVLHQDDLVVIENATSCTSDFSDYESSDASSSSDFSYDGSSAPSSCSSSSSDEDTASSYSAPVVSFEIPPLHSKMSKTAILMRLDSVLSIELELD